MLTALARRIRGMLGGRSRLALVLVICLVLVGCVGPAVFANDGSVETTFFGNLQDEGDGCGVFTIMNFVVEILTFGVGIAAAIGITISGITYLTAGGDDSKVTKAKRRIIEIVIGVAVYVVIWAILSFLLPGGALNDSPACKEGVASDSFFTIPVETPDKNEGKNGGTSGKNNSKSKNKNKNKNDDNDENGDGATAQAMIKWAKYYAEQYQKEKIKYHTGGQKTWSSIKKNKRSSCIGYATIVARAAGILKREDYIQIRNGKVINESILDKKKVSVKEYGEGNGKKLSELVKAGKVKPGDIIGHDKKEHIMIYRGKVNGKYRCYSAGSNSVGSGGVFSTKKIENNDCAGSSSGGNYRVGAYIHMK